MLSAVDQLSPGFRFGRLVVAGDAPRVAGRRRLSLRCDCGSMVVAAPGDLRKKSGATRSCGCFRAEFGKSNALDLSGRVFGRLTILDRYGSNGRRGAIWRCSCECGREAVALTADLTAGRRISCGCAIIDKPGLLAPQRKALSAVGRHKRRAAKQEAGGAFTAAQIEALFVKQRGKCAWCRACLKAGYHRDHRTALANGGTNDIGNIELLCRSCNLRKSDKDEIQWAQEMGRLL